MREFRVSGLMRVIHIALIALTVAIPCSGEISVAWQSTGGAYNHGGAWATGPWPDNMGLRQLIWSADDPTDHQAYANSTDYLDPFGTEYVLATCSQPFEDYAQWFYFAAGVFSNQDVGGHIITNGYLFSRIFQDPTPQAGDWYYQAPALPPPLMQFNRFDPNTIITLDAIPGTDPVELNKQVEEVIGLTPSAVPGAVQAEDFDFGGEGAAYHDTTATNLGGQYRLTEAVDIAASATASNGHLVGWTLAGEWLHYTINVASSGYYHLSVRVASSGNGGTFSLSVDGTDKTGSISVPNTGGWYIWTNVGKTNLYLMVGVHTARVAMVANGASGGIGNFDQMTFVSGPAPVWPEIPGVIEAENFDPGGEGVAYHDTTTTNLGGQYRPTEGVDISYAIGAGNLHLVGWTKAGEWMNYTFDLSSAMDLVVQTWVASLTSGGTFHIEFDSPTNRTATMTVPDTGAWVLWEQVRSSPVFLQPGRHVLKLAMDTEASSGFVGNFDFMSLLATDERRPVVRISTETPLFVSSATANLALAGTNNPYVVGTMWVSNAANGEAHSFAAPTNAAYEWTAPAVALVAGTNRLFVSGSNAFGGTTSATASVERAGAGVSLVDITSPATTVGTATNTFTVLGSNSPHVVGTMWVSNAANGDAHSFAAPAEPPYEWTVPIAVVLGPNVIGVCGTNAYGVWSCDAVQIVQVTDTTHYVSIASTNPVSPYMSWALAATNIQDAADAASAGGTIWVSNGTYRSADRLYIGITSNKVAVSNPVAIRSVNGPAVTTIDGDGARCVYLGSGASLSGFTLTNGGTRVEYGAPGGAGAGVYCETNAVVSNCVFTDNEAFYLGGGAYGGEYMDCLFFSNRTSAGNGAGGGGAGGIFRRCFFGGNTAGGEGGAAYESRLLQCELRGNLASQNGGGLAWGSAENCLLVGNTAGYSGGGTYEASVIHCTIVSNQAGNFGGGVYSGSPRRNCIVYFNIADGAVNNLSFNTADYACSTPLPTGDGNITNDPCFVNMAGGNFRLAPNSPCVDAGTDAGITSDLDGTVRPLDGNNDHVAGYDMGAYELLCPSADSDNDGSTDGDELAAGTDLTNSASFLGMKEFRLPANGGTGFVIRWSSATDRYYRLMRGTNLMDGFGHVVESNIPATPTLNVYTDETAVGPSLFYRIDLESPP